VEKQKIAIIGLGRIGSAFLNALQKKAAHLELACVAEVAETPAKAHARSAGIRVATLDEIVAMGDGIDVIFELTGLPGVRKELCIKLGAAENHHTVIASETIARLIWSLISDEALPTIAGRKTGY